MNTTLVIGDCHVSAGQNVSRFKMLSKMIVDKRPDNIVIMGDFLTMESLSAWDRNKRMKMENRRYFREIETGNEALDLLFSDMEKVNEKYRKQKRRTYDPKITYIEGNHEDRLTRFLDTDPTFEGFASVYKDLKLKERGIGWVNYREYMYIEGVGFTHIPFNEVKEIAGAINITGKAATCTVDSVVFGHTHRYEVTNEHKQGMDHLQQLVTCGCFISEKEDYVHGRKTRYWRGVLLLHHYKEGRFDAEPYALGRLERLYGHKSKDSTD